MGRLIRLTVGALPGSDRSGLVMGVDKPGPGNTGVIPGISRTSLSGTQTYSVAGQTISNVDFYGQVIRNANNLTFNNCYFHGGGTPSTAGLIRSTSAFTGLVLNDCTLAPDVPHWNWNGITGINFTLMRCNVYNVQDGMQIRTNPDTTTGVKVQQSWVHGLARYTAATTGIVHPSDTVTHNDCIQQFGGSGTQVLGNVIDGQHARQVGHWVCVGDPATEPYVGVALNSLPDGGPWIDLPNRGSGNEASGRWNNTQLSCMLFDDDLGPSVNSLVTDNWFYGGNFAVNGGGNHNTGSDNLGTWKRNKFGRNQGSQSTGGNATQTLNFQNSTWTSADADIPTTGADANVYEDNGAYITVRY